MATIPNTKTLNSIRTLPCDHEIFENDKMLITKSLLNLIANDILGNNIRFSMKCMEEDVGLSGTPSKIWIDLKCSMPDHYPGISSSQDIGVLVIFLMWVL